MKVTGSAVLHASPDAVYAALTDPAVLSSTIPGCESLTALGDDRYRMTVTAGVASIKGSYEGEVSLHDQQVPTSFVLRAKGAGAPGTVAVTVPVTISDVGDGTSRLDYAADAVVGGMVGGVGQRMLTSVSKKMAGQFFGAVDDEGGADHADVEDAAGIGGAGVGKLLAEDHLLDVAPTEPAVLLGPCGRDPVLGGELVAQVRPRERRVASQEEVERRSQ